MLVDIAFYVFSGIMTGCALMVISARNPVHSVLFLVGAFFNAAGLFILLGAEFLAMMLVVVYVGAVSILFLFVVMMLDIDVASLKRGFTSYWPIGAVIAIALFAEIILAVRISDAIPDVAAMQPIPEGVSNTEALGRIIYTDYVFFFQTAGNNANNARVPALFRHHHDRTIVFLQIPFGLIFRLGQNTGLYLLAFLVVNIQRKRQTLGLIFILGGKQGCAHTGFAHAPPGVYPWPQQKPAANDPQIINNWRQGRD